MPTIKDNWQATVNDDNEPYVYSDVTGDTVAFINTDERSGEKIDADMRLISAAPNLLAALQEVIKISDRKHDAWDNAKAAIAKAVKL